MREIRIELKDAMPLIKEKLAEGKEVSFSPSGSSMLPTLKAGRDSLILVSAPKRLRKYDIALYMRNNGQFVVHRVAKVGESYTFIGDNQLVYEKNISDGQIIALCKAYVRGGKRVELDSFGCRAFARLIFISRFFKRAYRKLASVAKATVGKK